MKRFKEISKLSNKEYEKNISDYWNEIDLLHECVNTRDKENKFVFYDGPPTANGKPGIHHVIARTLKDSVCRYKTMQGFQVKRKAGWDTHGLPVEIEVEKQLNLNNKTEIEDYGIGNFNQKCRESVFKYTDLWRKMTDRMAYLIDLDNPYITLDNNYVESVWWILDKMFKDGLMYEGHKILPYCTRCGTGLASHEVAQGYEEIKTATAFAKFKLKEKDEYFLAWTTTPWTLASNVALAVHPEMEYVKIKLADTEDKKGDVLYLAKSLLEKVISEEYEVLETMMGKDMEYIEYNQIMPFVEVDKKAFYIVCADYVTADDGTGIVHIAPAFGEDDYNVGVKYGLPVAQPVNEQGKFVTTPWEGKFVMDADPEILRWLKEEGILYKKQTVAHNYPHCWRCHTPLLYYAKPSWYIEVTKFKEKLIENNNGVEWYPEYVGEKRFGNWLENLNDWAISRSRYWGTPLPLWRCDCGHIESIGSRAELVEKAVEDIDESIDMHRPYVDDVHIVCPHCGKHMTRVKDVIDCWFDSGAMPFAQQHYPFENKDNFEDFFPADFICEGIDQTRGWFYSLLAISTYVTGKAPYKRVLVNDLILDKFGKKMSKSRGNGVDPFELFDQYGADALRWYLLYVSPAWTPTKFDEDGLKEVLSKFFSTLKNVYAFFSLYANTDGIDPTEFDIKIEDRPELDRWMISKFNNLVKSVDASMEVYDTNKVVRAIQNFVNEDLSNWYIRRSRRRFWATELTEDKKSVYLTTYEILVGVAKLCAPYAPYISEELYRNLTAGKSVHLDYHPKCDESLIDNLVEKRMDLVRDLVKLGRASREKTKIKVRQPVAKILLDGANEELILDLVPLIKEELNVKDVVFEKNLNEFMNFTIKPDFKVCGPKLGKNVKTLAGALAKADTREIIETVNAGNTYSINIGDMDVELEKEMLDIRISSKEGYDVEMFGNLFVIIDTNLSPELVKEGLARELVSKVQQLRKTNGYEMMDNIKIFFESDEEVKEAVAEFDKYIKDETLAIEITASCDNEDIVENLNGHDAKIKLEKIK